LFLCGTVGNRGTIRITKPKRIFGIHIIPNLHYTVIIMKFTGVTVLAMAATTVGAFAPSAVHQRSATTLYSTAEEKSTSKKDGRLSFMKSDKFHRKGFKEVRAGVEETINGQFQSSLVDEFKASNYVIEKEGVKVYLAKDFGFCWGVERSIALAYEAVNHYPGKKLHITNELIHNPEVNDRLMEMKVNLIEKVGDGKKKFDVIEEGDVVILPAFGASYEEMELLDKKVRLYSKLKVDTAS
jgi:4-hydroxy-3-methylbut-2-enyl diphosphate reductase